MKALAAAIVFSCGLIWMGCSPEGEDLCDEICEGVSCNEGQAPTCDLVDETCQCVDIPTGGTGGDGGAGGTGVPVTCDTPTGTITGVAKDENEQTISGMRITAAPQPSGPAVTTRSNPDGTFVLMVCAGATYAMSAETVLEMQRYVSTDSADRVDVPDDPPSATYDIDARRGYFLDATSESGRAITQSPGAVFTLGVSTRAWSREACAECTYRIVVGIEGVFGGWDEIGAGSYANNDDGPSIDVATLRLTAPSEEGEYGVYALIYAGTATTEAAREFYEGEDGMRFPNTDKYIRLATLTVE